MDDDVFIISVLVCKLRVNSYETETLFPEIIEPNEKCKEDASMSVLPVRIIINKINNVIETNITPGFTYYCGCFQHFIVSSSFPTRQLPTGESHQFQPISKKDLKMHNLFDPPCCQCPQWPVWIV